VTEQLFLWGDGTAAQLGNDKSLARSTRPYLVASLRSKRVLAVACGGSHTLAVVVDGMQAPGAMLSQALPKGSAVHGSNSGGVLMVWGGSQVGALGLGDGVSISYTPQIVQFRGIPESACKVTYIAAGLVTSAAVVNGSQLYVWGDACHGRLGLGEEGTGSKSVPITEPRPLTLRAATHGTNIVPVQVALGGTFSAFLVRPSSMPEGSPGVVLVCGALGADVVIRETKSAEAGMDDTSTEPGGMVEVSLRKLASDRTTTVVPVPSVQPPLFASACVSHIAAGSTHLSVIAQEIFVERGPTETLAAKFKMAAKRIEAQEQGITLVEEAPSAAAAPVSSGPPRYRGVLRTAGFGYLGHEENDRPKKGRYVSQQLLPVGGLLGDEDLVEVACGHHSTMARNKWGEVFAFGVNEFGVLDIGKYMDVPMPVALRDPGNNHYQAITLGSDFFIGLQYGGTLGDARTKHLARNAFNKWRKKAAAKAAMAAGNLTGRELELMVEDIAMEEGVSDAFKNMGMSVPQMMQELLRESKREDAVAQYADTARSDGADYNAV
jgi:hypothetical protein